MKTMDALYLAAIGAVGGISRSKLLKLVQIFGSAQAVYEAEPQQLLAAGVVKEEAVADFTTKRRSDLPSRLQRFCDRTDFICYIWLRKNSELCITSNMFSPSWWPF